MQAQPDCRICEHYELIHEEFPSDGEPIIVHSYHRCGSQSQIWFRLEELKEAYSTCSVRATRAGYGTPSEIVNEIDMINLAFREIVGEKKDLLRPDPQIIVYMSSPCSSAPDFNAKVGSLASLLEMNVAYLRKLVAEQDPNWKSLTLLKQLFKEKQLLTAELESALGLLDDVAELRNKIAPYHLPSPSEAQRILQRIGISYPVSSPSEWPRTSEILLTKVLGALRVLRQCLSGLALGR